MRALTLLSFAFLINASFAQWAEPSVNTPVRTGNGVDAVTPLSAAARQGGTYISWFENGDAGYVLRMQLLNVEGLAVWESEGLLVSDEPQNSALFRYDLASDLEGNAIVAFQDERTGTLDVVAYKMAPDGTLLWGHGSVLPTQGGTGLAPTIGVLSDNRVVIAWNTDRTPSTVAFQVVSPDGIPDPAGTQEIGSTGNLGRPEIVPCSDGGFWIQYVEQDGNFLAPGLITAKRFSATLEPRPPVVVSIKTIAGFYFPQPIPDGHDGFYVAFNTANGADGNLTDIFMQRLRADGTTWNNKGVSVEEGTTTQRYTFSATPALVNDDDGLMIAYQSTNLAQSEGGISVQRIDTSGTRMLGVSGMIISAASAQLPAPFGNAAFADGIVATTLEVGTGANMLSAWQIGLDGVAIGPSIDLCTVNSSKDDPTLTPIREGQAIAVWQDQRDGSGAVYAQQFRLDLTTGINAKDISEETALQLWPNPTSGTLRMLVKTDAATVFNVQVLDATGRTVWNQRQVAYSAEGIFLDLSVLMPGSYTLVATPSKGTAVKARFIRQ